MIHDPKVNPLQIEIDLQIKQFSDIKNDDIDYLNNNLGSWKFSENLNIFDNAHAVLVLTEWEDYKNIEWDYVAKKMKKPAWVFDARSIVNVDLVKKSGMNIWSLRDGTLKHDIEEFSYVTYHIYLQTF